MINCFTIVVLLANLTRSEGLAHAFRARRDWIVAGDIIIGIFIIAGVLAVIWGLYRFFAYRGRERPCDKPIRLFRSLCSVHSLGFTDTWLLWRVTRYQKLRDPARIFLEPERLNPVNLGKRFRRNTAVLRGIRARIFAGLTDFCEDDPTKDDGSVVSTAEK